MFKALQLNKSDTGFPAEVMQLDDTQPLARRQQAWDRLARDLPPALLETITEQISFEQAPERAADVMAGKVRGRLVVKIG